MKKICFALIWVCSGGLLFAQEEAVQDKDGDKGAGAAAEENVVKRRLSVEEAVALAFKNNLQLELDRVDLNAPKRAARYSWNNFFPDLNASGGLSKQNSAGAAQSGDWSGTGPESPNNPDWTASGEISVGLSGLNVALVEELRRIKAAYEAGLITLNTAKIQTEQMVRQKYLDLNIDRENLDAQEDSLRNADESVALAEKKYKAGRSSELDLLTARVERNNIIPELEAARDTLKNDQADFAVMIGLPVDAEFELDPISLENIEFTFDEDALVRQAASGKPEIQQARANVVTDKHNVNAGRLNRFTPSFGVGWTYNPTAAGTPWNKWSDNGGLSLSVTWSLNNLLPFSKDYQQNLSSREDMLRKDEITLAKTILETERDIYKMVYNLRQLRGSLSAQQNSVELAERTYDLTFKAYNAGTSNLTSLQNAEQNLRRAKNQLSRQRKKFLSEIIDLEYASGVPFGTLLNNKENTD